uniref:C2H2-type domain-containing protein n=1 Tax=Malurus cyaneus samueli TaxID=2593467 RepID=A0A8C5UCW2_9PASS
MDPSTSVSRLGLLPHPPLPVPPHPHPLLLLPNPSLPLLHPLPSLFLLLILLILLFLLSTFSSSSSFSSLSSSSFSPFSHCFSFFFSCFFFSSFSSSSSSPPFSSFSSFLSFSSFSYFSSFSSSSFFSSSFSPFPPPLPLFPQLLPLSPSPFLPFLLFLLSSHPITHARSHLRQMGVTEWYVNGSPIDTLREILQRRRAAPHPKTLPKSLLVPLEPPRELHVPSLGKKMTPGLSPPPSGTATTTAAASSAAPEWVTESIERREERRGGSGDPGAPSEPSWAAPSAREEMAPLNLSSRADPVRDIRCEFCGEFFENRKGLSSHARSHLRQMGVTEWSVNGSPIDTLREILRKKPKPCLVKKEPQLPPGLEPQNALGDDALPPGLALAPLGGRPLKPGPGSPLGLVAPVLGSKTAPSGTFLAPPKRPLPEERLGAHGEAKHKAFEMSFKAKGLHHDKASEACCELCGLYFENRKALASHARAHLRQFRLNPTFRIPIFSPFFPFFHRFSHFFPVFPAEACCELCGLYFENRKALASHARAHLRSQGLHSEFPFFHRFFPFFHRFPMFFPHFCS